MAKSFGINIVTQLNKIKATPVEDGSGTSFTSTGLGGTSFKLELNQSEKNKLALSLAGLLSIWAGPFFIESYTKGLEAIKRQEIATLDQSIEEEKTKLNALSSIQNQITDYEAQMKVLQEKLSIVESVQKNKNSLVRMVDFVTTQMPDDVWFTEVKVSIEKGAGNEASKFEIKGSAMTLQLVSDFMKRLENAVFFPTWDLVQTQAETKAMTSGAAFNEEGQARSSSVSNLNEPSEFKTFEMNARIISL